MNINYEDKTKEELIEIIDYYRHDSLTGMKLRKDFEVELVEKFYNEDTFYLVMFDVNNLHTINRDEGYAAGNDLIRRVANHISFYCPKKSYRYGGDEFMVFSDTEPDFTNINCLEACYASISSEGFRTPQEMLKDLDQLLTLEKINLHKGVDDRRQ